MAARLPSVQTSSLFEIIFRINVTTRIVVVEQHGASSFFPIQNYFK